MRAQLIGLDKMSNYHLLFDSLGELARKRYSLAELHFSRIGLNNTEAKILSLLSQYNDLVGQDEISQSISIDRSNVGRALKNLENAGLISRTKRLNDRRSFSISLTSSGHDYIKEIVKIKDKIVSKFFEGMTEEEATVVLLLLKKIN